MQVKHGTNVRGVQHLPARGLQFGHARAAELDQGTGAEMRTVNIKGDPAVVQVTGAALVGRDLGDGQGHQVGAQRNGRVGGTLTRFDQDVIVTCQGAGQKHLLVRGDRVGVGRVISVGRGHVAVAHVNFVGASRGTGVERHAQGLATGHADLVQARLAGAQGGRQRRGHGQAGYLHFHAGAGGRAVVGFTRWQVQAGGAVADLAFEDVVVQVRTHDDAPATFLEWRQFGGQGSQVAAMGTHITLVVDLAQQHIAQVPGVVRGQINRIGPAAIGGVDGVIADGVADLHGITHRRVQGDHDVTGYQIGWRRNLDQHGLRRCCGVVHFLAEFTHTAKRAAAECAGRIGDHEDVVGSVQITRRCHDDGGVIAAAGS